MVTRDFRFGVNVLGTAGRAVWQDTARRVEDLGYDVLLVPDHLGMPAPFPALISAAEVTSDIRLGTFVLNAGFLNPALLTRDVAGTDQLTDGRFELGLGAGYVEAEFTAAGLEFPSAGRRVAHLEHTVGEVRRLLADPEYLPRPRQSPIPLMVAGSGDRVLKLAAQQADIVGIAGGSVGDGPGSLAERVAFIRDAAGDRFAELELNLLILAVHVSGIGELDLSFPRRFYPDLSDEQLAKLPGVLHGSPEEIVDRLHFFRETYGVTYFAVLEPAMADFAKVINRVR